MKKIKVLSCVVTVAVMALIFFFSSQTATQSSNTSRGLTKSIAEFIAHFTDRSDVETIQHSISNLVRQCAHFALFFILGISSANTAMQLFGWEKVKLLINVGLFGLFYAITDEVHQHFVPGRSMMLNDIVTDFAGAVFGCVVFIVIRNLYLRRRKNAL